MDVADAKVPGTAVTDGGSAGSDGARSRARSPREGHLAVAELVSDRAAAPSPFGDDQEFPLPVESLTYTPTTTP
jgi:hypothetical protein